MGVRQIRWGIVAAVAVALTLAMSSPAPAYDAGPPCGVQIARGDGGVAVRILFAKNGAVQRYEVVGGRNNIEGIHDAMNALQSRFGPEGEYAPPLNIVSFKKGSGGLQVPDKAVDSCGRTLSFSS